MKLNSEATHASFDAWKTLIKSNPGFKPARNALVAEMVDYSDIDHLSEVVRSVDVGIDKHSDETGLQFGPIERLQGVFTELGLEVTAERTAQIATAAQELFLDYPLVLNEPDLLNTLTELRERYVGLCITSNTGFIDGFYMRQALTQVGVYQLMDAAFFSNEYASAKPHAAFFKNVVDWAGGVPENVIHTGDNYRADYIGAQAQNMGAVLLATEAESGVIYAPTIKEAVELGYL